ncbi:hypothetical protein ACSBR2_027617 [Camellia fascicularis]
MQLSSVYIKKLSLGLMCYMMRVFLMAKWGLKPSYKASRLAAIVLNSEEAR